MMQWICCPGGQGRPRRQAAGPCPGPLDPEKGSLAPGVRQVLELQGHVAAGVQVPGGALHGPPLLSSTSTCICELFKKFRKRKTFTLF